MTETIKANDPKNREEFLELIAKKADRPRHELANDPLVFINDLPETTLSGLDQDELLALAKTNSEAIHVDFKTVPVAKLSETLELRIQRARPAGITHHDIGLRSYAEKLFPVTHHRVKLMK